MLCAFAVPMVLVQVHHDFCESTFGSMRFHSFVMIKIVVFYCCVLFMFQVCPAYLSLVVNGVELPRL